MRKKWLINVGEDRHMRNTTFDNGRSSKQIFVGVSLFLVSLGNRKSKNAFESNQHKIKNCSKCVPVSDLVNLLHQFST